MAFDAIALVQTLLLRLLSYVAQASDSVSREHIEAALITAEPPEGANIMPTLAQQWREEGLVEGREAGREAGREVGRLEGREAGRLEGREAGRLESLLTGIEVALDLKFGATGLALLPEIRAIQDVAMLQRMLTAIRGAASVADLTAVYRADPTL